MAVADAKPQLSGHAAAAPVACVVGEVAYVLRRVRVDAHRHDPCPVVRQSHEPAEERPSALRPAEEAEVVPEHDDRVEAAEALVDAVEASRPRASLCCSTGCSATRAPRAPPRPCWASAAC